MRKATYFILICAGLLAVLSCNKVKAPRANFIFDVQKGGVVEFTNTTAGVVDSWSWNFGDGSEKSFEVRPVHRFTAAGTYNVDLTVTNGGGSHTSSQSVEIVAGAQENFQDHPKFNDANGYYYARNIFEYNPATPLFHDDVKGSAIAALYDSTNFLVSVGKVSVNGEQLEHNAENSYSKHGTDSSWYFKDASLYWSADGGSGYPPMVENVPHDFPVISGIISTTYSRTDSVFLFRLGNSIEFADSVIWKIEFNGETKAEIHTAGGINGVAFSKDEMAGISGPGNYVAKVIAFNAVRKTFDFKRVYYTKESYTETDLIVK